VKTRSGIHERAAARRTAGLVCAGLLLTPAMAAAQSVETVLYKKGVGPDGSQYRAFRRPVPSDDPGNGVAFLGKARGGLFGSANAVFTADPSNPTGTTVVKQRDDGPTNPIPGEPDGSFRRFERPTISSDGDVAFQSKLNAGQRGVFRRDSGGIVQNVARAGDPVPGMSSSALLSNFGRAFINDDDKVLFHATISNPDTAVATEGLFLCDQPGGDCSPPPATPTMLESFLLRGTTIPDSTQVGCPGALEICTVAENEFGISTWGIAFRGITRCDCTDGSEPATSGIFRMDFATRTIETLAMREECTSINDLRTYRGFDGIPGIEDDGTVAFFAETTTLATGAQGDAIFRCDGGCERCTATTDCDLSCAGVTMPEALIREDVSEYMGATLDRLSAVGIDDNENVVFHARELSQRRFGIFLYDGAITKIVLDKDTIPSFPADPGARFRSVLRPTISPAGRIAFRAKIKTNIPATPGASLGLFLYE
jgi:hypothetical protein